VPSESLHFHGFKPLRDIIAEMRPRLVVRLILLIAVVIMAAWKFGWIPHR
jgi:hypothetical protein